MLQLKVLRKISINLRLPEAIDKAKALSAEQKDERGMIVIEAAISFTIFITVCLAIVYFINIYTVHNRIQFAINSAAKEIASCTYICEALGVRAGMQKVQSDGSIYMENIDNTTDQVIDSLNKIQALYSNGTKATENLSNFELNADSISSIQSSLSTLKEDAAATASSIKASASSLKDLFSDSNGLIAGIIYMMEDSVSYTLRNIVGAAAAEGLTEHYLRQEGQSADSYLKAYGIQDGYDGLDFSGSTLLCDKNTNMRVIDIIVEYDIDLSFVRLVIPNAKVHMVQRVSVAAWVGGDDKRVREYILVK